MEQIITAVQIPNNQLTNWSSVRAFVAGNVPRTPDLQAEITISGPVTKNIGAQIAGRRRRDLIDLMRSVVDEVILVMKCWFPVRW